MSLNTQDIKPHWSVITKATATTISIKKFPVTLNEFISDQLHQFLETPTQKSTSECCVLLLNWGTAELKKTRKKVLIMGKNSRKREMNCVSFLTTVPVWSCDQFSSRGKLASFLNYPETTCQSDIRVSHKAVLCRTRDSTLRCSLCEVVSAQGITLN